MGGTKTASEVPAAFGYSKPHNQMRAGTSRTPPPMPKAPLILPTVNPIARKSRTRIAVSLQFYFYPCILTVPSSPASQPEARLVWRLAAAETLEAPCPPDEV